MINTDDEITSENVASELTWPPIISVISRDVVL